MRKKILIGMALLLATTLNAHASFRYDDDNPTVKYCEDNYLFTRDVLLVIPQECLAVHNGRQGPTFSIRGKGYQYQVSTKTRFSAGFHDLTQQLRKTGEPLIVHPDLVKQQNRNPMMQTRD